MSDRWTRLLGGAGLVALGFALGWFVRDGRDIRAALRGGAPESATTTDVASAPGRNPVFELELFSQTDADPARGSLCLLDGKYGLIEKEGTVYNRDSHVNYDGYNAGAFTAGIQGGEDGYVHDLGPAIEFTRGSIAKLLAEARFEDGVLTLAGEQPPLPVHVPRGSSKTSTSGASAAAPEPPGLLDKLFGPGPLPEASEHARVRQGHLYFVYIRDRHDGEETVGLLEVVDHELGKRVRVRGTAL